MKGKKQFPLISNSAMTGHKMQGSNGQNWMYVHIRTMKGLYLDKPLISLDMTKYAMSSEMKAMIAEFNNSIRITLYTNFQYHAARFIR
jgi:hypothetical protein